MNDFRFPTAVTGFCCEFRIGEGEDGFAYAFDMKDKGFISVFDGCGGMGSDTYSYIGGQSGARLAAACAAAVTDSFYHAECFRFDGDDSSYLKSALEDNFHEISELVKKSSAKSTISSNMLRTMPTTAAIAAFLQAEDSLECEFIWAGDSRGYLIDNRGMMQVTSDDLSTDEDAFENLRNDSKLSNVICADRDFVLHEKRMTIKKPVIAAVFTDGSFGYYSTPIQFEYYLLESLCYASSPNDWRDKFIEISRNIAGDDFTAAIAVYGFDSFEQCKKYYYPRLHQLYDEYIKFIDENTEEEMLYSQWTKYKKEYYRKWQN